jgi:hypothetical protein
MASTRADPTGSSAKEVLGCDRSKHVVASPNAAGETRRIGHLIEDHPARGTAEHLVGSG